MAEHSSGHVMVCVTQQKSCQRLIKHGAKLAREEHQEVSVVHVIKPDGSVLGGGNDGVALDYLFSSAKEYDADMVVLRNDNLIEPLVRYALDNGVTTVVLGESPNRKMATRNIVRDLESRLPEIKIVVV